MRFLLFCLFVTVAASGQNLFPIKVERGPVKEVVVLSGFVEPVESSAVVVKWPALVKRFNVQLGQEIKKGDLIAEVNSQYYADSLHFLVQSKQALESQLKTFATEERIVREQLERKRKLASQQIIAESSSEEVQVKLLNVQAKRASVERMIRDTLDTISVAEQKVKEANYYAPMGGIVSEVLINPKQISGSFEIKPGQIIARIDKPGRYKVKAHAIDTQAKKIMAGTKAVVSFESNNVQFEGNIASVQQSPLLQTDKLPVFNVGVVFDSNGATIPRGLLTRVVVVVTSKVNAIAVPWQAISVTPNGNFVTQLDLKKRKKLVPVELGIQGEDRVEVKDGLNEGDIVYTHVW